MLHYSREHNIVQSFNVNIKFIRNFSQRFQNKHMPLKKALCTVEHSRTNLNLQNLYSFFSTLDYVSSMMNKELRSSVCAEQSIDTKGII